MQMLEALLACILASPSAAFAGCEAGAVSSSGTAGMQSPASLTGRWRMVTKDSAGTETRYTLELELADGELTGSLTTDSGASAPIVDLKLEDGSIRFIVYVYSGDTTMQFTGKVDEKAGRISGEYSHEDGTRGTFTASRAA